MSRLDELSPARRRLLLGTLLVVAILVLALLAEGAVRVRQFIRSGYLWGVEKTYMVDPEINLRIPVPGAELGPIKINTMGFRGPEIESPKPSGRLRLAFLGASTTFSAEVSGNEFTWPHLVVKNLRAALPGIDFDYVNAAVPGYGVESSLKNLRHRVAALEPDVIVIYHGTNDISGNSFPLARAQGLAQKRTGQELLWLSEYSLLVYLVEKNVRVLLSQRTASDPVGKLTISDPELMDAPFRRDLEDLVEESQAVASLVALATFSPRVRPDQTPEEQLASTQSSFYYMPYMTVESLVETYDRYNGIVRQVAARAGALLIGDEDRIPGDSVNYTDAVHFTDQGSVAMAERVSDALLSSPRFKQLGDAVLSNGRPAGKTQARSARTVK